MARPTLVVAGAGAGHLARRMGMASEDRQTIETRYYTADVSVRIAEDAGDVALEHEGACAVVALARPKDADKAKALLERCADVADVRVLAGNEAEDEDTDADARACEDWCLENGCEYVRVHVGDDARDDALRELGDEDGMLQGARRVREAIECCAWPNMVPLHATAAATPPAPAGDDNTWPDLDNPNDAQLDAEVDALDRVFAAIARIRDEAVEGEDGPEDAADDGSFTAADLARRDRADRVMALLGGMLGE